MPSNRVRKLQEDARLQRRDEAWRLRTEGRLTQVQIAEQLGVHQTTILRDLRWVAERVDAELVKTATTHRAMQITQLEIAYREAMAAWEASKQPKRRVTENKQREVRINALSGQEEAITTGSNVITSVAESTGNVAYLNAARGALSDIRDLLGIEAPKELLVGGMAEKPLIFTDVIVELPE